MFLRQAGQAGQAQHGKHMLGIAYVMFVCIYTDNAMLCIGGMLLQLESPFGHIWNVLIWCSSKPSCNLKHHLGTFGMCSLGVRAGFLEVNLAQTYEVYNVLSIPKLWKHDFRRAEAVFWTPKAVKAL